MTADLVVTDALIAAGTVLRNAAVAVAGGRIVRIGTSAGVWTDAREVVDAGGMLAEVAALAPRIAASIA